MKRISPGDNAVAHEILILKKLKPIWTLCNKSENWIQNRETEYFGNATQMRLFTFCLNKCTIVWLERRTFPKVTSTCKNGKTEILKQFEILFSNCVNGNNRTNRVVLNPLK
jgi:hypothetical protein